ncbi:MAG: hypothetical protein KDG89_16040, partial [Geminicoccaceae bacterium]|nr:hypothetical protein [Geminicoccaceae bacterium]
FASAGAGPCAVFFHLLVVPNTSVRAGLGQWTKKKREIPRGERSLSHNLGKGRHKHRMKALNIYLSSLPPLTNSSARQ